MRHTILTIFLFFTFQGIALVLPPENVNLSFRRISPIGGFTYGSINAIGEDSVGFIWFGTVHGLYCFNTRDVRKFAYDPEDTTSIPGNSIQTIFCDKTGTLWIGTSQGMCMYDHARDQFVTMNFRTEIGELLGRFVRNIFQGDQDDLYFLSTTMLGKYNLRSGKFEKLDISVAPGETFGCSFFDAQKNIWVGGTSGTVWQYDLSSHKATELCHFRNESIRKIYADETGIWAAYNYSGLDCIDFQGKLLAHYGSNPEDLNRINHNRVRDLYKDDSGRLWISTYKGLSIIDKGKIFNTDPQELTGLPYNSVYKIFRDSKKGIWIGTWSGGLAYQSNYDNRFMHTRKDQPGSETDDEFVSSFTEVKDGSVIIGTEFGNLNKLNRISNRMEKLPIHSAIGKKIENIKSLLYDEKAETLWIGTFLDGLWFQTGNSSLVKPVNLFNDTRTSIYALARSDSGLWIGTYGRGLFHYNISSGKLNQFVTITNDSGSISNNQIRAIIVAKDGSLWIGTNGGLNHFNPITGKFKRYIYQPNAENGLSSDEIFALQQGNSGHIWIGTSGGGLNKYDQQTNSFESFRMKDGLIGNDVYGIQEDKNGMVWVSTDNGITCFDPKQRTFRNFSREDELQGNQFNPGAAFTTSNGQILFGDTKGVTLFTPEQMKTNPFPPEVVFTSLYINNVPVTNHTPDTPLQRTIQCASELKLSYHQNSLTFNFVANNFLLPVKNQFRYRLVGYDKKWIEAGTQNYATYTKIPPGDYKFEVVASNNDNLWNATPTGIKITISPPFWVSWYALLFYGMVIFLAAYFARKGVLERQQFKKELLLERLMHESEAQLQEMKLTFFTNISHEFRTPLTLIASPVNMILEKFRLEPVVREYLLTMQRNSERLLRLINQLIDVRKIELGKAVFQPQKTDLIQLCENVMACFEMEAKDKNIHLTFALETKKLDVVLDQEKADKIIFNLLSNAMKFTPENGLIRVSVYSIHAAEMSVDYTRIGEEPDGEIACVEVTDSGPGIPADEIRIIFDRFDQGKSPKSSGTGIGLHMAMEYTRMHQGNICVKSKPGSGSSFVVSFPLTRVSSTANDQNEELTSKVLPVFSDEILNPENEEDTRKFKSVTILVIEDNYELKNYLKRLLSSDYKVVTASNGKQGLETALTILPDLVITDVVMAQMDGFEVCRQLKNNILSSHIPVIMLTALNEPEKQIGGLETGADAYITKPFHENVLIAQINNILRSRAKLREVFSASEHEWADGMELLTSDRMLVDKATAVVEQHLNDKDFVVDHLADKLGISTSSFYRKIKALTNQSPTEFIRGIRLKKAVRLMNDGNTNVDEISYSVGFNSHSYFTSSFKKQFGMTPSDYLNDLKTKKK
jgi:signal transduction histidine kinase/ligand-binding sensor domain-containing protein/DNA-binding response OmpR family regulator